MRDLDDVVARARNSGRMTHALRARLARVEIEVTRGHLQAARDEAAQLAVDAKSHGFLRIAGAAERIAGHR